MTKVHPLHKNRPKIEGEYISIHPDWWKKMIAYKLSAAEQLATLWYWMEGTSNELDIIRDAYIAGSRTKQWRIKSSLKKKGVFPTERKEVYLDDKGIV